MKTSLFLALTLIVHVAFAESEDLNLTVDGDVVAPIMTEDQESKNIGILAVTPTAAGQRNPKELNELRNELNSISRRAKLNQAQNKKGVSLVDQSQGGTNESVFLSTTKRFGPETFTFFIAVGAVTYNTMWIKSAGDPLAMERHILALKDPIAHISFFAFMQANGHFSQYKQIKSGLDKMDEVTRRQMLRKISYLGLGVGSLASSFVSDVGTSIQQCANKWLEGKSDSESLESCNQALASWTVRKKFVQYFPQIISLWTSQALTEVLETGARKALTSIAKKNVIKSSVVAAMLEAKRIAYNIKAVDVVLTLNPFGGTESRAVKFIGSVTQIGAFVAVDHIVSPFINRPVNNILLPTVGSFDLQKLNNNWAKVEGSNWNLDSSDNDNRLLEESINQYTEDMQEWRNHLTSTLEQDFLGWTEMTKKILNQVDYSYKFYNQFLGSLSEQMTIRNKVNRGVLEKTALGVISNYPQRILPFYGVKPGPYKTADGSNLNDLYLNDPNELELRQKENVLNVAKTFKAVQFKDMETSEVTLFLKMIKNLESGDNSKMAEGLSLFRQISDKVSEAQRPVQQSTSLMVGPAIKDIYSEQFKKVINAMRANLGDPYPITLPLAGFAQAVASNSVYQKSSQVAAFDLYSVRNLYQFNKVPDLMMYNIICGEAQGYLTKTQLGGVDFLSPEFRPPSLLKTNSMNNSFCKTPTSSANFYTGKIDNEAVSVYLLKNLNYDILTKTDAGFNTSGFDKWWFSHVSNKVNTEMRAFDQRYRSIVNGYVDILNNRKGFYNKNADKLNNRESQFTTDISKNIQKEINVYLQIINRATSRTLDQLRSTPEVSIIDKTQTQIKESYQEFNKRGVLGVIQKFTTDHNYLETIEKVYQNNQFVSIYGKALANDNENVIKIHVLMNQYLAQVKTGQINENSFKQLILISKDLDTQINKILVQVGLKTASENKSVGAMDILGLDDISTETTSIQYQDVKVEEKNLTTSQRMTVAAIKGLRQVESELKKFARLQVALGNALAIEDAEMKALAN